MLDRKRATSLLPALTMLVFSLIVIRFPLFNYLGYEFSAACALVLPLLIGPRTINIARRFMEKRPEPSLSLFKEILTQALRSCIPLIAIPFIIAALNIYLVKNCSYGEGVLFYLLLPVITSLWSLALALLCAVLFRKAILFYFLLLIFDLLHPLYLGYATPAIYSYNFIYGFFPGFSYDEILTISPALVLFRGVTVVCSLFFALCSLLMLLHTTMEASCKEKIRTVISSFRFNLNYSLVILFFAGLCTFWFFRYELGFETSDNSIQKELSATYQTDHFFIHYAPGSFSRKEIEFVGTEHEFRFYQDKEALKLNFKGTISSYIYPDAETKRKFIGTGTTNIAKPWRNEIHLNKDSWQEVLKHELVHVIAGEFGMPIIHAHYNIGLTEGLATAVDNDWGNRTLHEYAAAMNRFGISSHPEKLIAPGGFMFQSSSVSYVLMGSFCKFLIDEYGIEKFKQLYGGSDVQSVYKEPYEALINDWQAAIDSVVIPDSWRKHIEYYFKRHSIFAKECARTIARLNQAGYDSLLSRNIEGAKKYFTASLHGSWNTTAFAGLVRVEYSRGNFDSVISLMKTQLNDSSHQESIANLLLIYGNSLWVTGDTASARKVFTHIQEIDLSEQLHLAASLRLQFLDDMALTKAMAKYFSGFHTDSFSISFLDSLLKFSSAPQPLSPSAVHHLYYIHSQISFRQKRYANVIHYLAPITFNLTPALEYGRSMLLGESYFWMNDYPKAEQYFTNALQYTNNEATKMRIEDWIRRCEWFSRHPADGMDTLR